MGAQGVMAGFHQERQERQVVMVVAERAEVNLLTRWLAYAMVILQVLEIWEVVVQVEGNMKLGVEVEVRFSVSQSAAIS